MNSFPTSRFVLAAAVLICAFVASGMVRTAPAPEPVAPIVPVADGPDMLAVFRANSNVPQASSHAKEFGQICTKAAATLELDAGRGDDMRLKTGAAWHIYRNDLRLYTTDGWSFASLYPTLPAAMKEYLDRTAGVETKEMDAATRSNWIRAMRSIGTNSLYAAQQLR